MPRKYKRKEGVRPRVVNWTEEKLQSAFNEMEKNLLGINEISRTFGIPSRTLRRRFANKDKTRMTLGNHPSLGFENEKKMVAQIFKLREAGFPPNEQAIRMLAYEFAEKQKLKHNFDDESKMAGRAWYKSFIDRHPELSNKQAEGLSVEKARHLSQEAFCVVPAMNIEKSPINKYDSILEIKEEPIQAQIVENMAVAGTSNTIYFTTADDHFEVKEEVIDLETEVETSPIQDQLDENNIVKKNQVKCIFCDTKYKRVGKANTPISCSKMTESTKEKLFERAWSLRDDSLLQSLIKTENIFYHGNCEAKYALDYASIKKDHEKQPSLKKRDVHEAYKSLSEFIKTEVYEKGVTISLSDINILYRAILIENGNVEYNVEMLRNKLVNEFGDTIIKEPHKQILYGQDIEESQAAVDPLHETIGNERSFDNVAYEIRSSILATEEEANRDLINPEAERDGVGVIPQPLEDFITCLINGPGNENDNSVNEIKIKEICNDIIISVRKTKAQSHTHVKIEFDEDF